MAGDPNRTDPPLCGDPQHRHTGPCGIYAHDAPPWAYAVAEAGEPWLPESPDMLIQAVAALAEEQENLWSDLADQRRNAIRGGWSMGCDWVTTRIVRLALLTGQATPWEQIPVDLLTSGVYQGILRAAGISFAEPDMDQVRRIEAETSGRSGG